MTAPDVAPRRSGRLRANAAYRKLWAAAVISETGDWLLLIALPLYVLQVSASALATSTVFLAELVPAVSLGMAGGPLIDRLDPARLLAVLTGAQAVLLLPLLSVTASRLWIIYAVAAVQSAITSITIPAQQAVIPSIVDTQDLPAANGIVQTASNVARLVGSPLGGLLLPLLGLRGLVVCDIVSFVASAVLLDSCRPQAHRAAVIQKPRTGRLGVIAEGWQAVRDRPSLATAFAISFLGAIAQGLFLVLFVLFVVRLLHAGDSAVGLLRGVQAVGGVLGGLIVGRWATRLRARAMTVGGLAAFGLISAVAWNSPRITTETWWYVTLFVAVGIPATALTTGLVTEVQRVSPEGVLGRVLSLIQVAAALGQGMGILAAGLLSGSISLTVLLNVQASCYLACAIIAIAGFSRGRPPRPGRVDRGATRGGHGSSP